LHRAADSASHKPMIVHRHKVRVLAEHWKRYFAKQGERRANGGHFPLEDVFLYATSRCNATCDHCFYWQELNREEDEIQLAEFEKLAESIPPFENLIVTGGETFLRRDLEEVVGTFISRGKCKIVSLNTNGFTPKMIAKRVAAICRRYPDIRVHVQVSLDGYRDTHSKIRNNPKGWDLSNETLALLTPMMHGEFKDRLYVGVLTVLCNINWQEIEPLAYHVRQHFGVVHAFEMVRGTSFSVWNLDDDIKENYNPPGMDLPPRHEWANIWATLNRINRESGYLNRFFHVMTKHQMDMLATGKKVTDCVSAGRTSVTIYSNADVAMCEFSKPFANLRSHGFDFNALWHGDAAEARRAKLTKCHCTHACYLTKNLEYSVKGQLSLAANL